MNHHGSLNYGRAFSNGSSDEQHPRGIRAMDGMESHGSLSENQIYVGTLQVRDRLLVRR